MVSKHSLFKKNDEYANQFKSSAFMQLVSSEKMANSELRGRLLDCVQVLSNYFQKVVMLRYVFCDDDQFKPLTTQHLDEEFGHNLLLSKDRGEKPPIWDPILESTCSWFAWKMFTFNDEQKTLLVHMVLETSANIFFSVANTTVCQHEPIQYLTVHEIDVKHEQMGRDLIVKAISQDKLEKLFLIQQQGWGVLNAACNRMLELVLQ
jgi:hypothetical protein